MIRRLFITMLALAGLVLCPAACADEWDEPGDDPGDDPGMDEPMPGDPEYCDWFGHEWTLEEHFDPTCEADGCDRVHCNNCGMDDEINFVPALGHTYVNGRCTRCGAEGSTTYVYVPAVAPTCTKSGHVAYLIDSDTNITTR